MRKALRNQGPLTIHSNLLMKNYAKLKMKISSKL